MSMVKMAMPEWIKKRLAVNPQEKFWQIHFREKETKTSHQVRCFLPRQLIGPLEEYLQLHRPILLQERTDPGTLFSNRAGEPLNSHQVRSIVADLSIRFVGLKINPHFIRDIFAYKWLEEYPEDYLTLSKLLWHKNIQTTLRIYGQKFDESNGVRRVEEWLDRRNGNN
jgi:site-specific recombinase XerD